MRYSVTILLFAILIWGCNYQTEKPKDQEKPIPFKTSELASLMKKMVINHQEIKESLVQGTFSLNMIENHHLKLDSAEATKESTKNQTFKTMTTAYQLSIQRLLDSDSSNRISRYNRTVDACINCHNNFCQLPIERIEKLYLKG